MDLVGKIQLTAFVTVGICLFLVWSDKRTADDIPLWYMVVVLAPLYISAVTFVGTIYYRIWR